MSTAVSNGVNVEYVLGYLVSDEELEAAAEETALSYTYETAVYNVCCS